MAGIPICKHDKCIKKDNCLRYNTPENQNSSFVEYQNICYEENEYKYFWKINSEVTTEEINSTNSTSNIDNTINNTESEVKSE